MSVLRIRGGLLLALSIRDFRLLWTGQLLSSLGSWLLLIAVPCRVFELTRSPAATGFAFVAESVPAMVIGPVAGVAVDRWDRRHTMVAVTLGQGGCILPVAFVHQPGQVAIVYVALLAESALGQFYRPAEQALVPSMVGRAEQLTSANALISVNGAVTRLAGASLGGIAFAALGLPTAVAIDAATYAAAAGCLLLLRFRPEPHRAAPRRLSNGAAEFREGLRHVSASRPLRGLLVAAAMFWAGNGVFTALLVLCVCMLLGMLRPRWPWRWVVSVGIFIPLTEFAALSLLTVKSSRAQVYGSFLAFLPGIAGAYGGSFMRDVVDNLRQGK